MKCEVCELLWDGGRGCCDDDGVLSRLLSRLCTMMICEKSDQSVYGSVRECD